MRERSRRDLLKGGVGLAAGAIGVGTVVVPAANAESGLVLRFDGIGLRARVHGESKGRLPKLDDHITIHGQVNERRGNGGTFAATGVAVRIPGTDEIALLEHHLFAMPDGMLTGAGQRTGEAGTFAITGGTGRYTGARGSYTAHLSPTGLGGDGTARFDLTLTTQER
jgi:hypothetical protein